MSTIIYLHGFASIGDSAKSRSLAKEFGASNVFAPDLPPNPDAVIKIITDIVKTVDNYPIVFVGTSLGGFWANYFAQKFDTKCVIVNPSTRPDISMGARVEKQLQNYITGEPIVITSDDVKRYAECVSEVNELYNGALVNVFLAKDDDVIPYTNSLEYFKYTNSMVITETGGHRYDSLWGPVIDRIKEITE